MNPALVVLFGAIVVAWCYILRHDITSTEEGERVDCSVRRTRTPQQRLDRLYDLACFPTTRIKWRHHFITATAGAMVSTVLLTNACHKLNPLLIFLSSFLPFFVVGYVFDSFNKYHGQHRNHPALAHHLRVACERDLALLNKN